MEKMVTTVLMEGRDHQVSLAHEAHLDQTVLQEDEDSREKGAMKVLAGPPDHPAIRAPQAPWDPPVARDNQGDRETTEKMASLVIKEIRVNGEEMVHLVGLV